MQGENKDNGIKGKVERGFRGIPELVLLIAVVLAFLKAIPP